MRLWRTKTARNAGTGQTEAVSEPTPAPALDTIYDDADFDTANRATVSGGAPPTRGAHAAPTTTEDRSYTRWTTEDEALLLDAHRNRTPLSEIADRLGRTKGAVVGRLHQLANFDDPPTDPDFDPTNVGSTWTTAEDAQLITGWRAGTTTNILAQQLQRTQKAVQIRLILLHEVGLPVKPAS